MRFALRKVDGLGHRIALGAHDDALAALKSRRSRQVTGNVAHKRRRARLVDAARHADARAFQIEQARELLRRREAVVQHDQRECAVARRQGEEHEFRAVRQIDRNAVAPPDALAMKPPRDRRRRESGLAIRIRMLRTVA